MKKLVILILSVFFVCTFVLPSSAEITAYDIAVDRLKTIRQDSERISEKELDQLLLNILAAKEGNPINEKRVQVRKILAWASQLFKRDMDINYGEKENLPPRAEALILKLEEIKHAEPLLGWSLSSKDVIRRIVETEVGFVNNEIGEQELERLLLAVWSEDISYRRKKKEIRILLYLASKDANRPRKIPLAIAKSIKTEEAIEQLRSIEKQKKRLRFKQKQQENDHKSLKAFANNFRKAKWGMSVEEVKRSESLDVEIENENTLSYKTKVLNKDVFVYYIFINNKLVRARYVLAESHSNNNDFIEDYNDFKEILIKKYGSPKDDNTYWKKELFKNDRSQWGTAISAGHLVYFSLWETQNSEIYNSLSGDNFKISAVVEYVSKNLRALEKKSKEEKALEAF